MNSNANPGDVFSVALPRRPYPGLRPFDKDEWPIFFGRERMADEVVSQLIDKRLLVVHGDSGCGKSSLVRAAVLPRLEQESARSGLAWRTCTALPGEAPLWNLAVALAALDGGGDERAMAFRRALNFGAEGPAEVAALLRRDASDHLCILVDQFEELFDHARHHGPEEAQALVDFLIALWAAPPPGLYAVLTMRSEFLGACARFRGFAETVNATQYLLPRMTHDDLLRAIREPALLFDGEVSLELAELLIHDAGGGQDQLPLIQHGLLLLYLNQVELPTRGAAESTAGPWRLDVASYDGTKGLAGLLSDHADQVAASALAGLGEGGSESRVVEDLFRALTDINPDGHGIRRPQTLGRLAAITGTSVDTLNQVIAPFRADGVSLVRPLGTAPLTTEERIDISHEALIRSWRQLADPVDGWLLREFRNGLVWRALLVQADSFERDPANVLGPTTTDERLRWIERRTPAWAERYGGGWQRVQHLLAESAAARDRELAEQEAAQRMEALAAERHQRLRRLYVMLGVLALMVLVTVSLSVIAWRDRQFAQEQLAVARAARAGEAEQRARAEDLLAEARDTIATLRNASAALEGVQQQLSVVAAESADSGVAETLYQVQGTLTMQVDNLNRQAAQPLEMKKGLDPRAGSDGPTVYIHIAAAAQRRAAEGFGRALAETGGPALRIPGVELVKSYPSRSVLRCFREEECRDPGQRLVKQANALLAKPTLVLEDLSTRYAKADNILPQHFEVWFAEGDIQLR